MKKREKPVSIYWLDKWYSKFGILFLMFAIVTAIILWPREIDVPKMVAVETGIVKKVPNKTEVPEVKELESIKESVKQEVVKQVETNDNTEIVGSMTGYGADCYGCIGITASGYDVRNTIYYNDAEYGQIRILAAPKEIPMYSIIRVNNVNGYEPFIAIVLDRGSAIKGTLFDLLCESEQTSNHIGRQYNIKYEIIRRGR